MCNGPMSIDAIEGDIAAFAQMGHQPDQRAHLGRARMPGVLEVADQANSNAIVVEAIVRRLAMGTVFLFQPPRADLDFTVSRSPPVADYKMITQLIPAPLQAVVAIKLPGVARFAGTVVDDDVLPIATEAPGQIDAARQARSSWRQGWTGNLGAPDLGRQWRRL